MNDPRQANRFLIVVTMPWGKQKLEPIHASYGDAVQACAAHRKDNPNAKYTVITGETDEIVNEKYSILMRGGTLTQYEAEDDLTRMVTEGGEGGDHDEPYHFELPTAYPEVLAWVHMQSLVTRGQLGGENDGEENTDDQAA